MTPQLEGQRAGRVIPMPVRVGRSKAEHFAKVVVGKWPGCVPFWRALKVLAAASPRCMPPGCARPAGSSAPPPEHAWPDPQHQTIG